MLKQNRNKSLKESMKNADDFIEHLLNKHRNCDKIWSYAKCAEEVKKNMLQVKSSFLL